MQARGSKGPPSSTFIPKRYCRNFHTGIPCAGFPIHFEGPRVSSVAPNLLSAQQSPHVVDQKLAKELAAHRLAGPLDSPPSLNSAFLSGNCPKEISW